MSYDFTDPSSMDKAECMFISQFCRAKNIKSVLEFGPGNSTQALIDGGVEIITAFEQDAAYAESIKIRFPAIRLFCYDPSQIPISRGFVSNFDIALIDGPTVKSFTPSRLNAALFCFTRTRIIMMHDTVRDRITLEVLEDIGMVIEKQFESERGLAVLRKHD